MLPAHPVLHPPLHRFKHCLIKRQTFLCDRPTKLRGVVAWHICSNNIPSGFFPAPTHTALLSCFPVLMDSAKRFHGFTHLAFEVVLDFMEPAQACKTGIARHFTCAWSAALPGRPAGIARQTPGKPR
jgi:hypothetical protein